MGYLDNSSVIVDAILTRKGRELLSKNQFNVTQFALGDDEIDYTLYNENHPNGTADFVLNNGIIIETKGIFTVADRRLFKSVTATGGQTSGVVDIPFTGTSLSQTVVGTSFSGVTLEGTTLFGSNAALVTSVIVIGLQSGARTTVSVQVNKEGTAGTTEASQARSEY